MFWGDLMEIFCVLCLLAFAVFGFSEFLHIMRLHIVFPKAKINSCLVIKLRDDTAEKQTLYTCEQFRWYGRRFADSISFNCDELSVEVYNHCQKICEKYGIEI